MDPISMVLLVFISLIQDLGGATYRNGAPPSFSKLQASFTSESRPLQGPSFVSPDWYPLGPGLNNIVYAIIISGNDVYVGGGVTDAGGNPDADYLARWDGCEWHACRSGTEWLCESHRIEWREYLFGGDFTAPFDHIGFWDGAQWNAMGSGLNAPVFTLARSGSDIYAGGQFTDAGGNGNADYVALWNVSSWVNLGSGLNDEVMDIEINGNDVYVVGMFLDAGGNQDADGIARWDGTNWNHLGTTMQGVMVKQIELDGNNVYISGSMSPDCASRLAYWDGNAWLFLPGSGSIMLIIGNNMFVADPTINCSVLRRYDINGQYWEPLPGGCNFEDGWISVFGWNGIDLYAGGSFPCARNILRYGEPDSNIPLILDIPTEICDDDPPLSLPTTQSGYTGDWSGEGVSNNVFDASGLDEEITLTFTPDSGQCVYPVDAMIMVVDCSPPPPGPSARDIYFPNIFSPNGDGVNDIVTLHSNANIRVIKSLRIYDRWGDIIIEQRNFRPNDPKYGWDGTYHGKKLNPGVFTWIAEVEFENGEMKIFFNDVTLVR